MDRRDEPTWVVIELAHMGEKKVEDGTLESSLRADLDVPESFPIFIPAATYHKGGKVCAVTLMEGYVFVGAGLPDISYYELERKPYVATVISSPTGPYKMRVLSTIPDREIREMRQKLREKVSSDIKLGDWVTVLDGTHKSLEGDVTGVEDGSAFVRIELRSLKLIATIPLVFLESTKRPDGE